jgi:hypothetical protein
MRTLAIAMLCGWLSVSSASQSSGAELKYVVLEGNAVNGIVQHRGTWKPTKEDLAHLEAGISQISTLLITGWPAKLHIEHPENYYRQYVPIIRGGQKLFYVSAFCENPLPNYWRSRVVVVSDGGTCFWQAFYDPATKRYSHLTINARA